MKTLVRLLSTMVSRSPWGIIAGTLAITLVLGAFLPQQETATGNEGFSPDTPEFLAQDVISEYFSDNSEEPVQVVVQGREGNDLVTVAGLQDYLAIREAINSSAASQLFKDRPGGDIVGYFDPLLQGLEMRATELGIPFETLLANLTDEDVKQGLQQSLEQVPPEIRGLAEGLYGESSDLSVPEARTALMVVFLNVADLDDPDLTLLQEIEVDMADSINAVTYQVSEPAAFSFALLFADTSEFQSEIGRLFGTAFLIIIAILLFVFWIHPRGKLTRFRAARRALADMGLTMLVIVISIVWMNGAGVLLGPKYLNIIGNFNEILQILPILLVGLGVDYAIHMTSRYREELGTGAPISDSAARATKTVGVALVLATATTSVGFLTNVVNPVTALRDFGILAAVGITSAFVLMLTVVPAIRTLLDTRAEASDHLDRTAFGH